MSAANVSRNGNGTGDDVILLSETLFQDITARVSTGAATPPCNASEPQPQTSDLSFTLNGKAVSLPLPTSRISLAEFLRETLHLTGTKLSCEEGGCGACTVLVQTTPSSPFKPVNACLRDIRSCHNQAVVTAEGISQVQAYLQEALADGNGSQCGFCSPGMVASMAALLNNNAKHKKSITKKDVELAISGNICRCTGYRPILDTFEKLVEVHNGHAGAHVCDIEDLAAMKCTSKKAPPLSNNEWVAPTTVDEAVAALREVNPSIAVGGCTGLVGVAKYYSMTASTLPTPRRLVDVQHIEELKRIELNQSDLSIGAAATLEDFHNALIEHTSASAAFTSCANHLLRVATPQVRAVATVAGNVFLTAAYPKFPSDVCLILLSLRATACVIDIATGVMHVETIADLLSRGESASMQVLCVSFSIPLNAKGSDEGAYFIGKIAPRHWNAHAIVNGAVSLPMGALPPSISFGGLVIGYMRCIATENVLRTTKSRSDLNNPALLNAALEALATDLASDAVSDDNRRMALALFYRAYLRALPDGALSPNLATAAKPPVDSRSASAGSVNFEGVTDPTELPISAPHTKISARLQTSGKAVYGDDEPFPSQGLHAALVLSTEANAAIAAIDTSMSCRTEGFCAFYDASELKRRGFKNDVGGGEPLFAEDRVAFHGQPLGIVVSTSRSLAQAAASLVQVSYSDVRKPILTFDDAEAARSYFDVPPTASTIKVGDAEAALAHADIVCQGDVELGGQYHFYMETQNATAVPSEGGQLEVTCTTQGPANAQAALCQVLGKSSALVDVSVRRVGGAYGGKISRNAPVACAAAVAAECLGLPVRLQLDLTSNMRALGSRRPHKAKYAIGLDKSRRIVALKVDVAMLQGAFSDGSFGAPLDVLMGIDGAYNVENWHVRGQIARTNTPPNTYCRAPGFVPGSLIIESAVDAAARAAGMAPEDLRWLNRYTTTSVTPRGEVLKYCSIDKCWDALVAKAGDPKARRAKIEHFNSESRFCKRGLSMAPMRYALFWDGNDMRALVTLGIDGRACIEHSCVEAGQGLNVKVAAVCAASLGIHLDDVTIKKTTTRICSAGSSGTGGSITSENCSAAVEDACDILKVRLQPYLTPERTFTEAIRAAMDDQVDLCARGRFLGKPNSLGPAQYQSYGAAMIEAEVDALTGESRIVSAELVIDTGISLNPTVDAGQVQGGFVMALGYLLTEQVEFDHSKNGANVKVGTWEYKPPTAFELPDSFDVTLLPHAPNKQGFLRSKATGEPPLLLGASALFAIKDAIVAIRGDDKPFDLPVPALPSTVHRLCDVDWKRDYTLS
ncbi:xanthine dehydrogenase [Pycnococcus provasolii]